ncbi:MAG: flagellar motor stator protein MotA [Vibrio sp.]
MKQIIALVVIFAVVFGTFMLHGGRFEALFKVSEIAVIFGAAFAGLAISSKISTLKLMFTQLKMTYSKTKYDSDFYQELLALMFELVNVAKTQNIKSLDSHIEHPDSSSIFSKYPRVAADTLTMNFIVDSFRQVISSKLPTHEIEALLEDEIQVLTEEYLKPSEKLHMMAESTPGLGILAAVMGIILTMQNLDADVGLIGKNIASALVGTFTGVFGCYCLFGPMSGSIRDVAEMQLAPLHCVKSVIAGYSQGMSAHLCANAGRKNIETQYKPTFLELENIVNNLRHTIADSEPEQPTVKAA